MGDAVDARTTSHFIEIDVIRLFDRFIEIDPSEGFALRVSLIDEPVLAAVEDTLFRRRHLRLERCRARDDFEERSGRIHRLDRAVLHRMILIIDDLIPVFRGDPLAEAVRIIARPAGHRKNRTAIRIDSHR